MNNDWISGLPDDLLQHILSFLTTKEMVQMSLVSKRWVNLWTSTPCLHFDRAQFGIVDENNISKRSIHHHRKLCAKFKEFVEMALSRHEAPFLDKFLIRFHEIFDQRSSSDLVRSCVSYAMKLSPRVFSMEAMVPSADLFACIFSCESVEEICLRPTYFSLQGGAASGLIPEVVELPRIRRLRLKSYKLDNGSITRLLSGCPMLEELSLDNCSLEFSSILVFIQKLKYLSLFGCYLKLPHCKRAVRTWGSIIKSNLHGDTIECTMMVEQFPPLPILKLIWKTSGSTAMDNASSFMRNLLLSIDLGDTFGGLSGVTVLELHSTDMKDMLEKALPKLGEFHYLKSLSLGGWCMICNFNPVVLFLEKSPSLEKLTLYNSHLHCRIYETDSHRIIDNLTRYNSMWAEISRFKNIKLVEIKLLEEHLIRVDKIEEASLLKRIEIENIEVVLSDLNYEVEAVFFP